MTIAASLLSGLLVGVAIAAEPETPAATEEAAAAGATPQHPTKAELEAWHEALIKTPRPKGCFTAVYPEVRWRAVPCKTPPHKLYPPRGGGGGIQLDLVGSKFGTDFSAVAPSGHLSMARGSFDSISAGLTECAVPCPGQVCPANPTCSGAPTNSYSLQLNTQPFSTQTCSGSPTPNTCQGWQQFVYSPSGGGFIQYWLLKYGPPGTACPAPQAPDCWQGVSSNGWCPYDYNGAVYCVVNAAGGAPAPFEPITSLDQIKVTGAAAGFGGMADDSITVTVGNKPPYTASGNNYFPDLANQWTEAEFNVFGDGNGDQAVFNSGATLHVRIETDYGGTTGPGCDSQTFTGESNNLTLGNSAPVAVKGSLPALLFWETNPAPAGGPANCTDATSVGDTHLTRFDGLYYDFQASGDFVLAQTGPDFIVHTRQARAVTDPRWIPHATINKAVATQMGKTRVALYIWPVRLVIDGKNHNLGNGERHLLPTGVQISRHGNVYTVSEPSGNRVRAVVNNNNINSWIDVTVGLGRSQASQASGLLGSPHGNGHDLKTADGTVLRTVSFVDLYHKYADSWRIQPNEALLEEDPTNVADIPAKPFFGSDLDERTAERVRAICMKAGVTSPVHLDACMLDTAVLGDETAARVHVVAVPPRHVLPRPELVLEAK